MPSVLTCITQEHDHRLITLAAIVCILGVYASFALGAHASRSKGRERRLWASTSVVATGCTAWATHFIALLAFRPGMEAGFEPIRTGLSLLTAIVVIGAGTALAVTRRGKANHFFAGCVIGCGVGALHYIGQSAYVVVGVVSWDLPLVFVSLGLGVAMAGCATLVAGFRDSWTQRAAVPLLILSIGVLHFGGMTAATFTFDPHRSLPSDALAPDRIAPAVASVCIGLLVLAMAGFKFSLDAKARLRRDRARLRELANVALEGLVICNGDTIVTVNRSFERLSGLEAPVLTGRSASSLLPFLDLPSVPELEERETELVGVQGQLVPVRVLRSEVPLGHKTQTVFAVRDQRERLRTEAQMRTLTFCDALTGLPNRARFLDVLTEHVASRRSCDHTFALLVIDLDRFKPVNDMYGHAAGDLLLRKVADRLSSVLREGDVVARLGGDEFAVLQTDARTPEATAILAKRFVAILSRPFVIDGHVVQIGASVGVALAPIDGYQPAELLHKADLALRAAKIDGKGTYRTFEPELDARMKERRLLEAGLRRAIACGEFELFYQPLLQTRSGRVSSAEALIRWREPERGLVSPAEFIPLAEETGLIIPLGEWVLHTACAEAATWPQDIGVAVNLSPVQFRDSRLVEAVKAALAAAKLSPNRLELEITEGVLLMDEPRTLATLLSLRDEGVRIAMDDFGTGYSSLSYLRRFPFDKIKIDRSFVRQLPADQESAAIIRAIITMGACLGMSTTVEGVETAEQFAFTTAEGCDHIQGYLVSRPLPANDFAAFLRTNGERRAPREEAILEPT